MFSSSITLQKRRAVPIVVSLTLDLVRDLLHMHARFFWFCWEHLFLPRYLFGTTGPERPHQLSTATSLPSSATPSRPEQLPASYLRRPRPSNSTSWRVNTQMPRPYDGFWIEGDRSTQRSHSLHSLPLLASRAHHQSPITQCRLSRYWSPSHLAKAFTSSSRAAISSQSLLM